MTICNFYNIYYYIYDRLDKKIFILFDYYIIGGFK